MKRKRILLIDDVRNLEASVIARNYWEGIRQLEVNGPWDLLLLDHDLASFDKSGREKTGYDVMLYLEQFPGKMPKKIEFVTSSPVGRAKMAMALDAIQKRIREEA